MHKERYEGNPFALPAFIFLLLVTIFPFLFTLVLTFSKVNLSGGFSIALSGVYNWRKILVDYRFYNALRNTMLIICIGIPVQYVIGLGLAELLNQKFLKGSSFFRVLFILPMTLSPLAVGYMWRMLFHPSRGAINDILGKIGISAVPWLDAPSLAIYSIIITDIWYWTPLMFIVLLAALQGIPQEVEEAARIDGASRWQSFFSIKFPMLLPSTITLLLLRLIEGTKIIDVIYVMTGGGPGIRSESVTLYAYMIGLASFDLSYGATIAVYFFLMIMAIYVLLFATIAKKQATREAR